MHYNVYIQNTGLVSEFANDESGQRVHYEKDYMLNLEHERAFSHNCAMLIKKSLGLQSYQQSR